jgi:hypothetical protein
MKECPHGGVCQNYRPRPPTPKGETVKMIPLGDGFYSYVDAADYEWLNQWTWSTRGGYAIRLEKRKVIYMHRQITKTPKGMIVDHTNRNKLDNTRANLRNVTQAENAQNRPKRRGTSSRFLGVSYDKKCNKYQARVYYQDRSRYIGFFADEIDAARAHDYRAVELFGDEAQVNFPEEWPRERRAQVYAQAECVRRELGRRAGRKVGRKEGKTPGRARPGGTGPKRRGVSARARATGGGGRDRASVKRQKVKGRNGGPEAGCTTRGAGRGGAKG